jgi:hypothetical protein
MIDPGSIAEPESAATLAQLPQTLSGIVTPNSPMGRPLLQTDLGLVSLQTSTDLPAGSRVDLVTLGSPTVPLPTVAGLDNSDPPTPHWASFDEAMGVLQQADPKMAQLVLARLPDFGSRFVPTLLAVAAAVQSGNLRSWLGQDPVKALEKAGRRDVVERLERELGELKTPVRLASGGDWQSLVLPLPFGQRVERIRLIVRRPPDDDAAAQIREEEGTRFLIDVDMSRLGPLQLDGLVKRKSKRFDLIIRSRNALPDDMRSNIGAIFARSLEGLDMAGHATFEQAARFIAPIPLNEHKTVGWLI